MDGLGNVGKVESNTSSIHPYSQDHTREAVAVVILFISIYLYSLDLEPQRTG